MEAEEFLNSKDIFNHPRIEDTNNKNSYDVAELLEEYASIKLNLPVVIHRRELLILASEKELLKQIKGNGLGITRFMDWLKSNL